MKRDHWQKAFPEMPLSYRQRVEATLASLPEEKEVHKMKLKKRFAVPVMALLAVMLLGTGLMATGTLTSLFATSSSHPTYKEMPTVAQLEKNPGFVPVVLDSFENGYVFDSAVVGKSTGTDDNGNELLKQKFISIDYAFGNDRISVDAHPTSDYFVEDGAVVGSFDGIDLYYSGYTNKCVPGDYEMTEQDKADEASGKYVFSFGTDTVLIQEVQFLTWQMDGLSYNLMAVDSSLAQEDLAAMAKEIIAAR
ncbi:MAG: hypothetical protein ACOX8R_00110 [Bacillota bacterium]|jgi:hypothetical protein